MCGIVGEVRRRADRDPRILMQALDCISHRGPDTQGQFSDGKVWLAHARLSIIDLSSGADQPMSAEDQRYVICYNGEVYNFAELAANLGLTSLKTASDTEVVLRAFMKEGVASFPMLNGIFAFAIYDKLARQIYMVRDRLGVKPLYYATNADGFAFASEIKALQRLGVVQNHADRATLHEWVYYGTTLGERTLYEGVRKLLPGRFLVCDVPSLSVREEEYWSPTRFAGRPKQRQDTQSIIIRTRELLDQAVKRQLVSDVPVGVFLSGGVDSSAITAFAARHYNGKLSTFSAGFDFDKGVNELPVARRIAARFGTDHHELHISGFQIADIIEKMVLHHDQPFSDAANIPLFLLSSQVKQSTKVVLQGDGGDELFGGYSRHSTLHWMRAARALAPLVDVLNMAMPRNAKYYRRGRYTNALRAQSPAELMALLLTEEDARAHPERIFGEALRREIVKYDPFARYRQLHAYFVNEDRVNQMLFLDAMVILPDVFLEKVDRATMAAAVEVRVPFLDNDLVEFCFSLSGPQKLQRGKKKWLLKKALEGVVPDEVLYGKKTGFSVPSGFWLKGALKPFFFDQLATFGRQYPDVLNEIFVRALYEEHLSGRRDRTFLLWKVLMLTTWANQAPAGFRF